MKAFLALTLLFCWSTVQARIPELDPAYDQTHAYLSSRITSDQSERGKLLLHYLTQYQVILIPGFHYEKIPDIFAPQISWLSQNKIDFHMIETNPGGSVEENANQVVTFIKSSPKNMVIMASSKGNLDALEALLKLGNDESLNKIRAMVSVQAPYFGTPLADEVQSSNNPVILFFVRIFLGGDTQSLRGLMMHTREQYMTTNRSHIEALTQKVKVLSLSTWRPLYQTDKDGNQIKLESKLWQVNKLMNDRGYKNDGMVPVYSGCLPKSGCVVLNDLDHVSTVSQKWAHEYDVTTLLRTLLFMALGD